MKLHLKWRSGQIAGLLIAFVLLLSTGKVFAANMGTVVPVVGQAVDLTYDPQRGLVYIANFTQSEVDIYSVGSRSLIGSIPTGSQPASVAISPDAQRLYVANTGSLTISAIDLNAQQVIATYSVSSRPDAVAVGNDGLVLILGPSGLIRLDPGTGLLTPLPVSVPAVPPGLPTPTPSAVPSNFLAGLVTSASGTLIIGLSTNRLFVYEVASGTVLRSRNVTGLRAILSIAPDGSRFMAGPFLFDTQTLAILGRTGTVVATLTGGSAFSVDGNTVYATFSTQTPINPLNTNNPQNVGGAHLPGLTGPPPGVQTAGVLQVMRASSLTPLMGLRLPEAINPKIVPSTDGQNLFALSTSGMLVIPIGQLNQLPVIGVDTTNLVLSVSVLTCNPNLATAQVQVNNLGGGRLTFTATPANTASPVIINQRSGVAPSTFQITYNPRAVSTQGTLQVAIVLVSPEAVNIEPAILVNLNLSSATQRGTIVPINGVGVDLLLDQPRQRLYIANYTLDQIEVYSIPDQAFLPPVRVGNRPLSMAMPAPSTLVVANSGAERISVVDLDQLQEVASITMGPIPLNATPVFPRAIAASNNAILFTAIPLPATVGAAPGTGSIWQANLLTGTAFPRLNLGPTTTNVIQGQTRLVAPSNGSAIVLFENNGTVVLYDPISDSFPVTRTTAVTGFRGTTSAAADGSFFLLDDTVFNSVLGFQGTLVPVVTGTATLTFGVSAAGANAVRIQPGTTALPVQTLQVINLSVLQPTQQFQLAEAVMDISPTAAAPAATVTRLWPPNSVSQQLGVNGQTQLLPRAIVVDSANNAYLLTVSGLTVLSLTAAQGRGPAFSVGGVVNAATFTAPVAPGSLISIFGTNLADLGSASSIPLPTSMGGSCVTVNGTAIPLLYTSPTQINAQLPPGLAAGKVTLAVQSANLGQVSSGVQVQVNAAAPGIFTVNSNGVNTADLFHSRDFSLVTPSNPATRDEVLILYATGLGAVNPSVPAGSAAGTNPLSVTTEAVTVFVGGHGYDVQFAGLAPGFVGTYQINILVPGDRFSGDSLPVVINAGSAASSTAAAPVTSIH